MIVSVAADFARFAARLNVLGRDQLPFAAALALNQTARTARDDLTQALPSIFSAKGRPPTPFTMHSIGTSAAHKNNLAAMVFVKRQQARYLAIEETGGVRLRAPGAPVLTPVAVAVNQYGNIPRALLRKLLADPENYFLGEVRGIYGLWERVGRSGGSGHVLRSARGLRLLVAFHERAVYRARFGFAAHVRASVNAHFLAELKDGLGRAIATSVRH